jgi:hypothetical protein
MKIRALLILLACVSIAASEPTDMALDKEVKRLAIPEKLMPAGKQPLFIFRAQGVQIYKADAQQQWVLAGPDAKLMDYRTGAVVGTHSKGPVWVDASGSKLAGKLLQTVAAPNPQAVAWLLLAVKNENGGRFANVTHIQRVDTWGGMKPAAPPTGPTDTVSMPYQATYIFWGDKPAANL